MQRGVAGPPRMSSDAVEYYSAVFEKIFHTPEWQDYRARSGLLGDFLAGPPLREYWRTQLAVHGRILELAQVLRKARGNK